MTVAPDLATAVRAWRVWYVVESDRRFRLRSVMFPVVWPVRQAFVAECLAQRRHVLRPWRVDRPDHPPPASSCKCGVYAAGDADTLARYADSGVVARYAIHSVFGEVSLWGTVVECEYGWRGSYAYPRQLYLPEPVRRGWDAEQVAFDLAEYGIPILQLDEPASPRLLRSVVTSSLA